MTIEEAAEKYMNSDELHYFQSPCDLDVRDACIAGAKWALSNQWQKIERDKDGFAINTSLGEVLIMDDSGEVYINDDDDYIHNTHCVYWMTIPNLHEKLK